MIRRLSWFAGVGAFATSIHYIVLYTLFSQGVAVWLANGIGFLGGFAASFTFQQRYTFKDRLGGFVLNRRASITIFVANVAASGIIGKLASGAPMILPLFPAAINYTLYYCMTSSGYFRKARR